MSVLGLLGNLDDYRYNLTNSSGLASEKKAAIRSTVRITSCKSAGRFAHLKFVYMQSRLFSGLSVVNLVDHATCMETYLWRLISNTSRVVRHTG